ncbi:Hypothetical protein CINCED_3A013719 [Cinara cedri]|uniref:Uncharacterized protein n=1 Tax=Cinara cedri TaxID=506608 RepID=A0A5E4MEA3_9HEMI|nr:Hypothetical protein CINCED_3A013719 [Cinara cedri]
MLDASVRSTTKKKNPKEFVPKIIENKIIPQSTAVPSQTTKPNSLPVEKANYPTLMERIDKIKQYDAIGGDINNELQIIFKEYQQMRNDLSNELDNIVKLKSDPGEI